MARITALSTSIDISFQAALQAVLDQHEGIDSLYRVWDDTAQLLHAVRTLKPDVLLIDGPFHNEDALALLPRVGVISPGTKIILFYACFEHQKVIKAILHGAKGCLMKTAAPEQWVKAIQRIHHGDIWFDRKLLMEALDGLSQQALRKHPPLESKPEILTGREWEVVCWVGQGMTNKEIARQLDISITTVKTHLQHIFSKLKVGRRMQLPLN